MEWLNSTPDLTWLQLILISFYWKSLWKFTLYIY